MNNPEKKTDRQIWDKAVEEGTKERPKVPEITDDRPAIRAVLRESRRRHTVRVKSSSP